MRELPLSRGQVALVDDEDYEAVAPYKWSARFAPSGGIFYAVRRVSLTKQIVLMHRVLLDAPRHLVVDHINGNGVDNRRCNIRLCTHQQNLMRRVGPPNKTGYRGVHQIRPGTYRVAIMLSQRGHYVGTFYDPILAARAYDDAARRLHGEFARLNFPVGSTPPSTDADREIGVAHGAAE